MSRRAANFETVSASELAVVLGVSAKAIARLAASGDVVKAGRGQYDRDRSVAAYCVHLRKSAAGRSSPAADAKARLVSLQADAIELKNMIASGEIVLADGVAKEWSGFALSSRNALLAAMSRASMQLPQLSRTDLALIDEVIRDVLTAIAEDRPPGLPG